MDDKLSCPYCRSAQVRLWEAVITVRLMTPTEGGPGVERKCPVFRCVACGRTFDEVKAEEAAEERSFT